VDMAVDKHVVRHSRENKVSFQRVQMKLLIVAGLLVAAALGLVTNLLSNFLAPKAEKKRRLVWVVFGGLILLSIVVALIPDSVTDSSTKHSNIAKSYIPSESELPKGFRISVESATASFPIQACEGDAYQIMYENVDPDSRDGKALLFRTAVCQDVPSAAELFNSNFDAQWPDEFVRSMAGSTNEVTLNVDAPVFDFGLGNVDEKFYVRTRLRNTNDGSLLGTMTSVVFRSENVVLVIITFVKNEEYSYNQAVYYSSLGVEKLQE